MSFADKVKTELSNSNIKMKKCCKYALIYGMFFSAYSCEGKARVKIKNASANELFLNTCKQLSLNKAFEYGFDGKAISVESSFFRFYDYNSIANNVLKCARCQESFLKGVFLARGTMNDPAKSYRLEIVFGDEASAHAIQDLLLSLGIDTSVAVRNGKYVAYLRKSQAIEDFLAFIGAPTLSFEVMNNQIHKELVNNANRVTNCDAANIYKAVAASTKYIEIINELIDTGYVEVLPDHLKEMAYKRIENSELSFMQLGKLFNPVISKSGVYHRLEKIVEYYNDLKDKKLI